MALGYIELRFDVSSKMIFIVPNNSVFDFLISFFFITTYISMIYMPKLLTQHFKEQFPDILYSVL
jgi:hypothetical protein